MSNIKKGIKNQISKPKINKLLLSPLIITLAIIPLLVRSKIYNTHLSSLPWYSTQDTEIDVFLYFKSLIFTIIFFLILTYFIYKYIDYRYLHSINTKVNIFKAHGKYKFTPVLIPLSVYAFLAVISTLLSKYASYGIHGVFYQFESIFVLLGYCIIVYYAFLFINTDEDVQYIFKCLIYSILILCILGFTQAIGHDFFATSLGKSLIGVYGDVSFTFEKNRVYLTLYNPNYVGLYTSLILPILLTLFLFSKKHKNQFIYAICILGLLLCMIASSSRNGFVALCFSIIFIVIFLRKLFLKHWKIYFGTLTLLIICFIAINMYMNNSFIYRLQSIFTESNTTESSLSSILTHDDNIEITYNNSKIYIQLNQNVDDVNNVFIVSEENKNVLQTTFDSNSQLYNINDSRFSTFQLQVVNLPTCGGFNIIIDGVNWYFSNQTGDNIYYYCNSFGKFITLKHTPSALLTNYGRLGSGRGYIWSRTFPLLKDHILIGSGADTFLFEFPQDDYVGRYSNGITATLTTKPHNMYLQIAVQTGVLSLIAFLIFYGIYFITCFKLYINNHFETYMSQAGVAIFIGTLGYMISGFFNDSTITVSPVFWALIGIGIAINYKLKFSLSQS